MANVTYLLGAGASANCLPIINNFNERLTIVKDILTEISDLIREDKKIIFNKKRSLTRKKIIDDFEWLIFSASAHQTIDTLAKKFYHTNHDDLLRLKRTLIFFFQFEQKLGGFIRGHFESERIINDDRVKDDFDKRYDSFIAALLKNNLNDISLLDNVKVLSWNYDCQFEIALQNYSSGKMRDTKINYQIFPNATSFNFDNAAFNFNKFGLIKLNGSAEYDPFVLYSDNEKENILELKNDNDFAILDSLIDYYEKSLLAEEMNNSHLTYFNYSWESAGEFTNKYAAYMNNMQTAFSIAQKTDILVVIGYSFPFFNREIDRNIMNSNSIRKVYVQDTDPESRIFTIKESFSALRDTKIQPISFTNSFFLPPEL